MPGGKDRLHNDIGNRTRDLPACNIVTYMLFC
jgi:hypothetical protein